MTVNGSAPECRPQNAKRVMKYKFAQTKSEIAAAPDCMASAMASAKAYLQIVELAAADVDPDETGGTRLADEGQEDRGVFSRPMSPSGSRRPMPISDH